MECVTQPNDVANVPTSGTLVCKDECVYSFNTPESDHGLYVSLASFLGFRLEYAIQYFEKTGNQNFLRIKAKRVLKPVEVVEGATANAEQDGVHKPEQSVKEYDTIYQYDLVIMPAYETPIDYNTAAAHIKDSIEKIIAHESAVKKLKIDATAGTWNGEVRQETPFADQLLQLQNDKHIPPSGWKCEKCDKTENLWLNLTDGTILCGRKYYDGSGGNGHALEHYRDTQYPLAVKLGTISADCQPDVFCYPEDDLVIDKNIKAHLSFWGINMEAMVKTEKTTTELELEKSERLFEFLAINEDNNALQPIYGPGLTGMRNLGNSCYLNSVMQVLFSIPYFQREFSSTKAENIFMEFPENPVEDFKIQMCKLGNGLLSGEYSKVPDADTDINLVGIAPVMFKNLVGKNHKDFSTKTQQDAYEYYAHVLDLIDQHYANDAAENPVRALRFLLEYRYECLETHQVKYQQHAELALPLIVPIDQAVNLDEVKRNEEEQAKQTSGGKKPDVVLYKLLLSSCLEKLFGAEIIDGFQNPGLNHKTTAKKTTRMLTMPDYLMLRVQKFTLGADWSPTKLNVSLDMPDILDLSEYRAPGGPQSDEREMRDDVQAEEPPAHREMVKTLVDMGFPETDARRACQESNYSGIEPAIEWIDQHIINAPSVPTVVGVVQPDVESLNSLLSMGFAKGNAERALVVNNNNLEAAVTYLISGPVEPMEVEAQSQPTNITTAASNAEIDKSAYQDGSGKYRLVAFVSHMGCSSQSGHYVCHILKKTDPDNDEYRWVIFNDEKVALSVKPPKDLGYLYLYQRM